MTDNNGVTGGYINLSDTGSIMSIHARVSAGDVVVDPKKFDEQMSFQQFFKLVSGCIALKGFSFRYGYDLCADIIQDIFPLRIALDKYRDFLAGEVIEGDVSPKISSNMLRALYFGKVDALPKPTLERNIVCRDRKGTPLIREIPPVDFGQDPDKIPVERFLELYKPLRQRKRVSIETVWKTLPEDVQAKRHLKTVKNYIRLNGTIYNIPSDIGNMLLDHYEKFFDWERPVSSDEVLNPFVFEKQVRSMVSIAVVQSQIKKALQTYGRTRTDIVREFSECIGLDEIEAGKLLRRPSGRDIVTSRLRVAIVLRLIEGGVVPQNAIDLHNHHLGDKYKGFDVSKMRERLNEIFERANLSPKFVYDSMSDDYKQSVDFNRVAGWFDGKVDRAKRSHVESFLHQAIRLLEQTP